jgi:hypothetical protein
MLSSLAAQTPSPSTTTASSVLRPTSSASSTRLDYQTAMGPLTLSFKIPDITVTKVYVKSGGNSGSVCVVSLMMRLVSMSSCHLLHLIMLFLIMLCMLPLLLSHTRTLPPLQTAPKCTPSTRVYLASSSATFPAWRTLSARAVFSQHQQQTATTAASAAAEPASSSTRAGVTRALLLTS